jgi:hypothetical protein
MPIMTLTEILNNYIAERTEIENTDVEAIVRAKMAEIEVKVRAEVETEVANNKKIANIKIETIQHAIEQVKAVEAERATADENVENSEHEISMY